MKIFDWFRKKVPEIIIEKKGSQNPEDYEIRQEMMERHPHLVELILQSEALKTHQDKQGWFDAYIVMNKEHIEKLQDILERE